MDFISQDGVKLTPTNANINHGDAETASVVNKETVSIGRVFDSMDVPFKAYLVKNTPAKRLGKEGTEYLEQLKLELQNTDISGIKVPYRCLSSTNTHMFGDSKVAVVLVCAEHHQQLANTNPYSNAPKFKSIYDAVHEEIRKEVAREFNVAEAGVVDIVVINHEDYALVAQMAGYIRRVVQVYTMNSILLSQIVDKSIFRIVRNKDHVLSQIAAFSPHAVRTPSKLVLGIEICKDDVQNNRTPSQDAEWIPFLYMTADVKFRESVTSANYFDTQGRTNYVPIVTVNEIVSPVPSLGMALVAQVFAQNNFLDNNYTKPWTSAFNTVGSSGVSITNLLLDYSQNPPQPLVVDNEIDRMRIINSTFSPAVLNFSATAGRASIPGMLYFSMNNQDVNTYLDNEYTKFLGTPMPQGPYSVYATAETTGVFVNNGSLMDTRSVDFFQALEAAPDYATAKQFADIATSSSDEKLKALETSLGINTITPLYTVYNCLLEPDKFKIAREVITSSINVLPENVNNVVTFAPDISGISAKYQNLQPMFNTPVQQGFTSVNNSQFIRLS